MEQTNHSPPKDSPPKLDRDNHVKFLVHPSLRSAIPGLTLAIFAAFLVEKAVHTFYFEPLVIPLSFLGFESKLVLHLGLLIFLVLAIRPLVKIFDAYYEIGAHHLYLVDGSLSLNRCLVEIPYEDMRGVRSDQTIIDRILHIGSVLVWTSSADSPVAKLGGLPNPDSIVSAIRERIDLARLKKPHASPGQEMEVQIRDGS